MSLSIELVSVSPGPVENLRQRVAAQLETQRMDPNQSAYGDGLVRGLEIALEEIDEAIRSQGARR